MALSSTKEFSLSVATQTLIFFLLFFPSVLSASHGSTTNPVGFEFLKVAPSEFAGTVRSVVDVLQDVTSILSEFGSGFGDSLLSNAVSDCLDLLDLSSDELDWSVSATQTPQGTYSFHYSLFLSYSECILRGRISNFGLLSYFIFLYFFLFSVFLFRLIWSRMLIYYRF